MNELKLYENNDKILDYKYDIFVPEKNLVGTFNNDIEIKFSEFETEIFEDDLWSKETSLDEVHKWGNEKADEIVKEVAKSIRNR